MSEPITSAEETDGGVRAANLQAFIDEMHAEPIRRTVADDLDPAAVEQSTAAEVLTLHQRHTPSACLCGWSRLGHSFTQHQADMLAAAGLLVTPGTDVTSDWDTWVAEHDAHVAARALREAADAEYQRQGATLAVERLLAHADRIERQEEGR